jgi:hypothetical protein
MKPTPKLTKKILTNITITLGIIVSTVFSISAQKHDLTFKVRELSSNTGANLNGVKIDINDGEYIAFTTNGVATIKGIPDGNYPTVKFSQQEHIQYVYNNLNVNADKTFNASMIKKNQTGPWGTCDFVVDWYKKTCIIVGTTGKNVNTNRWRDFVTPIPNVFISNATLPADRSVDSLLLVNAINVLEAGTGEDLITLVPSNTTQIHYDVEMRSNTNFSSVGTDVNGMIIGGRSYITTTTQTKRVIHEITQQFDMSPFLSPPNSVMDSYV